MHETGPPRHLGGLALAGIVVAILAVGLAQGQDDWHAPLVLVGALLESAAVGYATRRVWLGYLTDWRKPRPELLPPPDLPEGDRAGQWRMWSLTTDEALIAAAMAIAGIVVSALGNLI
ncbi:MAG TPA: hypothetical protein VGK92_05710 [Gaiellales bacterium]|jgi:hypothetical protein